MLTTIMNSHSHPNFNKNNNDFEFLIQENLVPITFGELIAKDKIQKNNSENISVFQNDVCHPLRYVKILMDTSIIHNSFVHMKKFNTRQTSANKWSMMAGSFSTLYVAKDKSKLYGSYFCYISHN